MRENEVEVANAMDIPRLTQRFDDALVFAAKLHAGTAGTALSRTTSFAPA
jgi:hypothetical protein